MADHATVNGFGSGLGRGGDIRDRLILALYAQLKAERDTREALEYVIRKGAISAEVLEAIAADPIPVATKADIAAVEKVVSFDRERRQPSAGEEGTS